MDEVYFCRGGLIEVRYPALYSIFRITMVPVISPAKNIFHIPADFYIKEYSEAIFKLCLVWQQGPVRGFPVAFDFYEFH